MCATINFQKLYFLNFLCFSRISDNGAKHFATFLNSPQSKGKLEVLQFSLNSLKDKGAIALAEVCGLKIIFCHFFERIITPKAPREVGIIPRAAPSEIISTFLWGFWRHYSLKKSDINNY